MRGNDPPPSPSCCRSSLQTKYIQSPTRAVSIRANGISSDEANT